MGSIQSKDFKVKYYLFHIFSIFVLISFSIYIIYSIFEFFGLNFFNILFNLVFVLFALKWIRYHSAKILKKGINNYNEIQRKMKELENHYGEFLRSDLTGLNLIISNERHFPFLFFELFVSAFKYSLEIKDSFYIRDKGWIKRNYKSSQNALLKYMIFYTRIYEGLFQFFITYLIVLIMIKRNVYNEVKNCIINKSKIKLNNTFFP